MNETTQQDARQLDMPFPVNEPVCRDFLDRVLAIEDEMDRLRQELHDLRERYKELLPLRAVTTALKVVRARKKLAEHPKEPLSYGLQGCVEDLVERHMLLLDFAKKEAVEALARGIVPDMTQAEARRLAGPALADAIVRGDVTITTGKEG